MKNKEELNSYYVYIYLDPRNPGKWYYKDLIFDHQPIYVGKGKGERINSHLYPKYLAEKNIKAGILRKILRMGLKPIRNKIFENIESKTAFEIEIDMIKHFGRLDKKTGILANQTDGGEGNGRTFTQKDKDKLRKSKIGKFHRTKKSYSVKQLSLTGEVIKIWDYLASIQRELGFDHSTIRRSFGSDKGAFGYRWEKGEPFQHPESNVVNNGSKGVYQYSLNGDFIDYYESINLAKLKTGSPKIADAAHGRNSQSGEFQWFFEYQGPQVPSLYILSKQRLSCFDENMNLIKEYSSLRDAANETNFSMNHLRESLRRGHKHKGFYWRYNHIDYSSK